MSLQQVSVSKTYRTCTAHYLDNYVGKCANLHGHNYVFKVTVHMTGVELALDDQNMLTDFGVLKQFCKEFIEPWDHALITPMTQEEVESRMQYHSQTEGVLSLAAWGIRDVTRVIGFGENPTAEGMARFLAGALADMIEQEAIVLPKIVTPSTLCNAKVEVWETEDSMAEWSSRVDLTNIIEVQRLEQEKYQAAAVITRLAERQRREQGG